MAPQRICSSIIFVLQPNGPQRLDFVIYLTETVVNITFNTLKHASLIKVKWGEGGAKRHTAGKMTEHLKLTASNNTPLVLLVKVSGTEGGASGGEEYDDGKGNPNTISKRSSNLTVKKLYLHYTEKKKLSIIFTNE